MHYPNIPYWEIRFSEEDYATHAMGSNNASCGAYIAQPTRKGGMVVTGRARCLGCRRLVGRKAWRQVTRQLEKNTLGWDTYVQLDAAVDRRVVYRVFTVERSEKNTAPPFAPTPCPQPKHRETIRIAVPDGGEPLEIQVSPAVAKRLRDGGGQDIVDEFGLTALENWVDQVEAEEAIDAVEDPPAEHPWPKPGHKLHGSNCSYCATLDACESTTGFSYGKLTAIVSEGLNKKKPHVKKVRKAKSSFTLQKGLLSYSIPAKVLTAQVAGKLREAVRKMPITENVGQVIEDMIDLAMAQSKKERSERVEGLFADDIDEVTTKESLNEQYAAFAAKKNGEYL